MMEDQDFWSNQANANRIVGEVKQLNTQIEPLEKAAAELSNAKTAYDMAREAGTPGQPDKEFLAEADEILFKLASVMDSVELRSLMSGRHDYRNASPSVRVTAAPRPTIGPRCFSACT